ncbi:MAG: hypothetical protein KAY32_03115 [Candidatus Eisenbacteria sp.]|nr:hypothetical protein [Candidatus Eisenbacteria bacterium]
MSPGFRRTVLAFALGMIVILLPSGVSADCPDGCFQYRLTNCTDCFVEVDLYFDDWGYVDTVHLHPNDELTTEWCEMGWPYGFHWMDVKWECNGREHERHRTFECGPGGCWNGVSLPFDITECTCGPCVLPGTQITMADGTHKLIERIHPGEMVRAYDERSGCLLPARVTQVFTHTPAEMTEYYLVVNGTLRITPNHPLYLNGSWVQAGAAQVGGILRAGVTTTSAIETIERVYRRSATYNLEVEPCHTYFADGILVHNNKQHYDLFRELPGEGPGD